MEGKMVTIGGRLIPVAIDVYEEIQSLKDKLAVAEERLDWYISSKEVGLDRGLYVLKQALSAIRGDNKDG